MALASVKRCLALDDLLLVDVVRSGVDDVCRFERCEPVETAKIVDTIANHIDQQQVVKRETPFHRRESHSRPTALN